MKTETGKNHYEPNDYASTVGSPLPEGFSRLIEVRLNRQGQEVDPLDDLVNGGSIDVAAWMRRKAELADGTRTCVPVCDPNSVLAAVNSKREELGEWKIRPGRRQFDAWDQVPDVNYISPLTTITLTHRSRGCRGTESPT